MAPDDSRHCSAALLTDGKPSARDGVWWWAPRRDPAADKGVGEAALDVMLGAGGNRGCVVCGARIRWVAHAVASWSLLLEDEERAQGLRPVLQRATTARPIPGLEVRLQPTCSQAAWLMLASQVRVAAPLNAP